MSVKVQRIALLIAVFCLQSGILVSSIAYAPSRGLQTYNEADLPSCGKCSKKTLRRIKASCSSKASVSLYLTDGTATLKSRSTCEAFAQSVNNIQDIVSDWIEKTTIEPDKMCTEAKLQDTIRACGTAIAKTYTSTFVLVDIDGIAHGCASGSAKGKSFASAFAGICVDMWLGLTNGFTKTEGDLQVKALKNALSSVWAETKKSVCQTNTGYVADFEESFANKINKAISCVFAEVAVKICKSCKKCTNKSKDMESLFWRTEAESNVKACSKTVSKESSKSGNAGIVEKKANLCKGEYAECCDPFYADKKTCVCGRNCEMTRITEKIWEDSTSACFCDWP